MIRRLLLALLFLFFLSFDFLFAESLPLEELTFLNPPLYQVEFQQQKQSPMLLKPFISSGVMIFWKDKGILWRIEKPFHQSLLISPKGIFRLVDNKTLKNEIPPGKGQSMFRDIMVPFLNGDLEAIKQNFYLKVTNNNKIIALPISKAFKEVLKSVQMQRNKQGWLREIVILSSQKDSTKIIFSHPKLLKKPDQEAERIYALEP